MAKALFSTPTSAVCSTRETISDSIKSFFCTKPSSDATVASGSACPSSQHLSERADGQPTFEVELGSYTSGSTFTPFQPSFDPPAYDFLIRAPIALATDPLKRVGIEEDIQTFRAGVSYVGQNLNDCKSMESSKPKDEERSHAAHRARLVKQDKEMEAKLRSMGL